MKSARISLAALLVLPVVGCAQEPGGASDHRTAKNRHPAIDQSRADDRLFGQDRKGTDSDKSPRRLETVTWNSVKHELTWVISKGEKKEGASYKALTSENYLINMDDATMSFNGDARRFSKEEAANVHVLMDLIAKYAIDSTVWWDDGQGEPVNGDGKTPNDNKKPERPRRDRVNEGVATLHVSAPHTPDAAALLQWRIRQMEKRLAELKRLQTLSGGSLRLTSYSPAKY